jgi:glutamate N-acetyltransferase/amino-acid N-acetyltransferase
LGIRAAAARLAADEAAFLAAARGILTTDKGIKIASRAIPLSAGTVHLAGMCKGAGMIGPKMATMLAILTTDATLTPAQAQELLAAAVDESFNCISVEGHMSTNDTVLLLASGQATQAPPTAGELVALRAGLTELCIELAKQIPDDGEGASHLIALEVRGLRTREEAHRIAATVANSALVKTAVAGGDPNWGRIVSAAGYAGVPFDPGSVDVAINGHLLYERGTPVPFDARTVSSAIKSQRETQIVLTFREGTAAVRYWTSDLNVAYVRFNADYTT